MGDVVTDVARMLQDACGLQGGGPRDADGRLPPVLTDDDADVLAREVIARALRYPLNDDDA